MKEITGELSAKGLKFGITVSRFNELITQQLLQGAKDALMRHGCHEKDLTVVWVPGAFEVPITVKKLAETGKFDALIALGAVIRGATAHFDIIANQSASGLMQVSLESKIPVLYGILTPDSIEQALERAGTKAGNKGYDVAVSAIEMVNVLKNINKI